MSLITTKSGEYSKKDIKCYKLIYLDSSKENWIGGMKGGRTNGESFSTNKKVEARGVKNFSCIRGRYTVDRGYIHSYKQKMGTLYESNADYRCYAICIIPKGTYYFENTEEYASDSIIVFSSRMQYFMYKLFHLFN